jgi:Secretion system C-terminal sorting domain
MKKIYAIVLFLAVVSVGYSQQNCVGIPVVRNISYFVNGQQICAVYVDNMLPNAPVTLFGPNLSIIPTVSGQLVTTDATGYACYVYPCGQGPVRVNTCNLNGCCTALVPFASTLPIRLDAVNAKLKNDAVTIDWSSVFEIDAEKYIVERSTDGRNFISIGEVSAAGSSYKTLHYSFVDNKIEKGNSYYYRLRLQDFSGSYEYSKVSHVNNKAGSGVALSVFPNPFVADIQVVGLTQAQMNIANIRVFDMTGRAVTYSFTGANEITIDPAAPKGVYILKALNQTFRIVKQ